MTTTPASARRPARLATALVLSAGLALGATSAADGAGAKSKTEVTAKIVDRGLVGRVKSAEKCEANRKVVLVEKTESGETNQLKTDKTDDKGRYEMGQVTFSEDVRTAYVKANEAKRGGTTCLKGKSNRLI